MSVNRQFPGKVTMNDSSTMTQHSLQTLSDKILPILQPYKVKRVAIFGSVVAFGSYLTLLGRIGPDRAAYVTVLFPIIALGLSTFFEGLTWNPLSVGGVALVLAGNAIALTKISAAKLPAWAR